MKTATTVVQMLIRFIGAAMLVLGVLFWTGHGLALIPLHILLGLLLVLSLWALVFLAARSGVSPGFTGLLFAWSLLMPLLGLTQARLLLGGGHWVVQILHLLVGLGAIGQAENLVRRIRAAEQTLRMEDR